MAEYVELNARTEATTIDPNSTGGSFVSNMSPNLKKFKNLLLKAAKGHMDPWAKYEIEKIPAERVRRHRYLAQTGKW